MKSQNDFGGVKMTDENKTFWATILLVAIFN